MYARKMLKSHMEMEIMKTNEEIDYIKANIDESEERDKLIEVLLGMRESFKERIDAMIQRRINKNG